MRNFLFLFLIQLSVVELLEAQPVQTEVKEEKKKKEDLHCLNYIYKAKKEGVPVYKEPDETSGTLANLSLGEEVCYIGQQESFAILNWKWRAEGEKRADSQPDVAYARLSDLWDYSTSGDDAESSFLGRVFRRAKSYYQYLRYGGVPEDALLPYSPLVDRYHVIKDPKVEESKKTEEE